MTRKLKTELICIASAFLSTPVSATILNFSDLKLDDFSQIPQGYGDHVDSLNDGIGSYNEGNGYTPNVSVSYQVTDAPGNIVENWLLYWSNNYGDLVDVAFSGQDGHFAEITLSPDQGYSITLNGFDIAGWSKADLELDLLQVINKEGAILWDSGVNIAHGAGAIHDHYNTNISSNSEITIRWGTNWNIGIDNIDFTQSHTDEDTDNNCVAIYAVNGSLNIPCVNVTDDVGGITTYKVDLQLIPSSNPLLFELKSAEIQMQELENNKCGAIYNQDNALNIPCLRVPNLFEETSMYKVKMQLIPLSTPLTFELITADKK